MTQVAVDVLKDSIKESFARKFPGVVVVNKKDKVNISGTDYSVGMLLPFGSTGGLPDFGEILQLIIVHESPVFALKLLSWWYHEHLGASKWSQQKSLRSFSIRKLKIHTPWLRIIQNMVEWC